jgi:exonuclease SbcC
MRLVLDNFRCFKHVEINFPDNGTVLIFGNSGIGKTSIFKAINFALYGKENRHIIRHGEKKCKVQFEYSIPSQKRKLIITRTKNPSHLKLQNLVLDEARSENIVSSEDDEAQEHIYKVFGKDFMLTSYMAQKSTESFFYLPNNEKSSFLQKLSIKDFDVEALRKKTREIIRKRKDRLIAITSEIKVLRDQIHLFSCNQEEPILKLDLKGKSIDEFLSYEEKLREKNKNSIVKIKEELQIKYKQKSTLEETYKKIQQFKSSLIEKQSIINDLNERLEELSNIFFKSQTEIEDWDPEKYLLELNSNKDYLHNLLNIVQAQDEFIKLQTEYENLLEEEKENIIDKISVLSHNISELSKNQINEEEYNLYSVLLKNYDKAINIFDNYFDEEDYLIDTNINSEFNQLLFSLKDTYNTEKKQLTSLNEKLEKINTEFIDTENEKENLEKTIQCLSEKSISVKDTGNLKCPKCSIYFYVDKNNKVIELEEGYEEKKQQRKNIQKQIDDLTIKLSTLKINKQKFIKDIDTLKILVNDINNDILSLKDLRYPESKTIIEKVKDYSKVKLQIDALTKELNDNKKILLSIKEGNYTSKNLRMKYDKLENSSKKLKQINQNHVNNQNSLVERDEISIKKKISDIENDITKIKDICFKKETLEKSINKIQSEIDYISTQINNFNQDIKIEDVSNDILILEEKLSDKEKTKDTLQRRKEKIDHYIIQKEKWDIYIKLKDKIDKLENEEKLFLRGLSTAETMLKYINDSETLSLLNIIQNINSEIEEYVLSFFGEGVSIILEPYKEDKSGEKKNCIDVVILKDGEKVPLDSLSGGEFDRVALAFFLAFNKVAKSDLIMLDECLASLHSELVEDIVEMIKTKLSNKLVLFTLHQANVGIFDEVIDVEQYKCCN